MYQDVGIEDQQKAGKLGMDDSIKRFSTSTKGNHHAAIVQPCIQHIFVSTFFVCCLLLIFFMPYFVICLYKT